MLLTELPTEILDAVAEYVPAKALWRLARTCSILHEVALKQLWYQVRIYFSRTPGRNPRRSHMDRLCIHKQSPTITEFGIDCFCRRSNVAINMDVIEPLMRRHSRRPLPFGYVRRLVIILERSDLNFVNAFTSYKPRRCKRPCVKMVHYYSQLFEIISNLNLASILVKQAYSYTPKGDIFNLVDYLATLSPAPIFLSMVEGNNKSILFPTNLNLSHLRMAHLDFSVYQHGVDTRLSQSLLAEFLQSMAIPNLERVSLYCRVPIAATTEEFGFFFAHCKTLKILRLHGVYPVGTTQNWIPNSVTVLHLLAAPNYDLKKWSKPGQHFENLVTILPNVTELLFSSSKLYPFPISPHQLSLPNLRRLIVKGKTPYLEFIFQQYSQSVQEFRAYNIPYNELAPLIHKILPLQKLIVLYNKSIIRGQPIENWLELISQLHNIYIAILTPVYLSESDCNLACRTLRENKVDYILLDPDGATKPMRPRTLTRLGFYMGCDICAEDDSPLSKRSRIIAQSFNH